MTFWSSQTLTSRLPTLIDPFDSTQIAQSSYTLAIGNEIFITKDYRDNNSGHTKKILSQNEAFTIPAGQFAFLLTKEKIEIPDDTIAFISMKASFKYKGLINISGFHVDPGFKGKLLFSVYNAGPSPIHLRHDQPCFLIWFSSLDHPDSNARTGQGFSEIPMNVLNQMSTDEIYSLQYLTKEFREVDSRVSSKLNEIDSIHKEITLAKRVVWVIVVSIFSILLYFSSSIISVGKFVIEQKEVLANVIEYKAVLDDIISQKHTKEMQTNSPAIGESTPKAVSNK